MSRGKLSVAPSRTRRTGRGLKRAADRWSLGKFIDTCAKRIKADAELTTLLQLPHHFVLLSLLFNFHNFPHIALTPKL